MTKKLLVIASSLLFIVGCESELDNCIEANTSRVTFTTFKDGVFVAGDFIDEVSDQPIDFEESRKKINEKLKPSYEAQKEMGCDDPIGFEQDENESDSCWAERKKQYEVEADWSRQIEEMIAKEEATKLCNSQGIY